MKNCKKDFVLTRYHIKGGLSQPVRLALVTDLHEHRAESLIDMLAKEKPELILIAGDTFERCDKGENPYCKAERKNAEYIVRQIITGASRFIGGKKRTVRERNSENVYAFFMMAEKIAPVYLSKGNHEWYLKRRDLEIMKKYHVTLLDNEDAKVQIKGQKIRIGGLSTKYDMGWLESFCEKDGFKVLLSHHPEYYEKFYQYMKKIDLIFSGHAHGGQWRIGGRGVFAPGQGLFPKYSHGIYEGRLVVSSGCSNTAAVPRFNNPCELVVLEIGK